MLVKARKSGHRFWNRDHQALGETVLIRSREENTPLYLCPYSLYNLQTPPFQEEGVGWWGGGVVGGGGGGAVPMYKVTSPTHATIFTATHHTLKQKRYPKHEVQCQSYTPVSIFTQRHKPSLYHQVLFFFNQTTKLLYRPEVPTQKGDSHMQHSREVIYKVGLLVDKVIHSNNNNKE